LPAQKLKILRPDTLAMKISGRMTVPRRRIRQNRPGNRQRFPLLEWLTPGIRLAAVEEQL